MYSILYIKGTYSNQNYVIHQKIFFLRNVGLRKIKNWSPKKSYKHLIWLFGGEFPGIVFPRKVNLGRPKKQKSCSPETSCHLYMLINQILYFIMLHNICIIFLEIMYIFYKLCKASSVPVYVPFDRQYQNI